MPDERYTFGPFELDVSAFRLSRDGSSIALQPKALELLILLVRAPGTLVSRESLLASLWPDVVVTEHSLRQAVKRIRDALGPPHEALIETVPRKGLRFCAPVARIPEALSDVDLEDCAIEGHIEGTGSEVLVIPQHAQDTFVGRELEQQEIIAWLKGTQGFARLLSVLGPAGVGKTRLALHVLHTASQDLPVWFVDLTEARDVEGICMAMGRRLKVPLGHLDIVSTLGHSLSARGRCLVVLDNCEQVAKPARQTLARWLERATDARFLVTSREPLELAGELLLRLAPLAPDDALDLFLSRARARGISFTADERAATSELVRCLDGLPLSIELAVGRLDMMSPVAMLLRMKDRFRLLSGGRGHHQTLRAALDWSYQLLDANEQSALSQLSVFEGGFSLEAFEAIIDVEGWPIDVLHSLVRKSLVGRTHERFTLLLSVQQYAGERIIERGQRQAAELSHGRYFSELAISRAPPESLPGVAQTGIQTLEIDNLVAAARRALARSDALVAARCSCAAGRVFSRRGPFRLGTELLEGVLALRLFGQLEPTERYNTRLTASHLWACLGDLERSLQLIREALDDSRTCGNRKNEANLLLEASDLLAKKGEREEAFSLLEAAVTLTSSLGRESIERWQLTVALEHRLAGQDLERGRLDEARARFESILATSRTLGYPATEEAALSGLAILHSRQGHREEARVCYESELHSVRVRGDRTSEGYTLTNLGIHFFRGGDLAEAMRCHEAALLIARELGSREQEGRIRAEIGNVHHKAGEFKLARASYETALLICREVGILRTLGIVLASLGINDHHQGRASQAIAHLDEGICILRSTGDRYNLTQALIDRAKVAERTDDGVTVREMLDEIHALQAMGSGAHSELGAEIERLEEGLATRSAN